MNSLQLELNPLWLVLCALIAGGFSFFLYFKYRSVWAPGFNRSLSVLRFLVVFGVLALLLSPFIKTIKNQYQKPQINVLIDQSASVGSTAQVEAQQAVNQLQKIFNESQRYQAEYFGLSDDPILLDSLTFNQVSTHLQKGLTTISESTAGEHIVATILVSDGIVNQGLALEDITEKKPVLCIGVGDTTEKKDIVLKDLYANPSTFKGNEFPIQASIFGNGFIGQSAQVQLLINDQLVKTEVVKFDDQKEIKELIFKYTSTQEGFLKVDVKVKPLNGEQTVANNFKTKFVRVKESKQRVAIIARNPHPDIKALHTTIKKFDPYEVEVFVLSHQGKKPDVSKFDLFVLHQFPCRACGHGDFLAQVLATKKPRWLITGALSDYASFNAVNQTLRLSTVRNTDEVSGRFKDDFSLFKTDDLKLDFVKYSPPLITAFSEVKAAPETIVLMDQMIGTVPSNKPLVAYNGRNGVRELVLLAEGIWHWKMTEFLENENHEQFEKMVSKFLGLLDEGKKEDQFRARIGQEVYNSSEKPQFSFTSKNTLGELVYGNQIELSVFKSDQAVANYRIKVSESNSFYSIPPLESGFYTFTASTEIGGKRFVNKGSFSVETLQLENKNLQADFDAMRVLSQNTGGQFYQSAQVTRLEDWLNAQDFKNKVISNEEKNFLNHLFWPLLLLLILVSVEWIARKILGDV